MLIYERVNGHFHNHSFNYLLVADIEENDLYTDLRLCCMPATAAAAAAGDGAQARPRPSERVTARVKNRFDREAMSRE